MAEDVSMEARVPVSKETLKTSFKVPTDQERKRPFLIGVAGGTCCGKSEVCKKILKDLGQANIESQMRKVIILSQESFYRDLDEEESAQADTGNFNFDHPGAFDDSLCLKTLKSLLRGEQAVIQKYSFKNHSRETDYSIVHPADVIIFEGILALYNKEIRTLLDMKIFVDTDSDTRLARRVLRDILEHGRDIDNVLSQYTRFVKPAFEDFTLPTKKYADVIIPRGADNTVAIDLIVQHIKDLLNDKSADSTKKRTRHQSESGTISSKIRPH
ncbi:uridine-cytidine kinase 2-like [Rhopilema esculentum]|uniref:uridine-cytidine kinase 2-like n=1 Tax=Rhopilema esculentum TaxID=499914 RepID=UPI0031E2D861